ncbi:MAG: hypothetical protein ACXW32_14940, partial [Limisphaerales bacterium]
AQVASVTLVSSTQVAGVYTRAAGQSLNLSNRTFTVPVLGNTVFYQVSAPTAVTISGIAVAGGNAVINYN